MGHKRICTLLVDAMDTLLFLFFHLWSCLEWSLSCEFCSVYLWMPCALFVCTTTRSAIFLYLNYVIQSFCTGQSVRCLMRFFPLSCGIIRWVETISHWNTVRIEQKACSGYGISICYSIKFTVKFCQNWTEGGVFRVWKLNLNRRWHGLGMEAQFEQKVCFGYGSSICYSINFAVKFCESWRTEGGAFQVQKAISDSITPNF